MVPGYDFRFGTFSHTPLRALQTGPRLLGSILRNRGFRHHELAEEAQDKTVRLIISRSVSV